MAEKRFIKGLFKDTGYIDQPDGSWRHARNMILNRTDGSISNEGGTWMEGHLGTNTSTGAQNDKVVGAIEVNDDKVILFVTDVINTITTTGDYPRSEIGIWEKGVYTPLFNPSIDPGSGGKLTNDLNFSQEYPIEGTFKIDAKGDLIVYWTDDLNPPRAFNIDRQIRESQTTGISSLYGISPTNIDNIDILNLFPYSGPVPHVDVDDSGTHQGCVIEGGGLLTAVYYLGLAYVDDDLVATNFLTVSNPISIVDEFDYTLPTNKKDGTREGSQTTKAIKWDISNLNTNYKYLRPVVIRSKGDAMEAFKLNDIEFTSSTTSVIFSGLETRATGSVEEVIIDTIAYDTAKTIQQLDNVLYLGNTTGSKDVGYQKYANNIKLRSRVDTIEDFDIFYATVDNLETGWGTTEVNNFDGAIGESDLTKSYRYAPNIFKYKGYMRDEIYAFYIAFIMKDGSMSYAYHIPGREDLDKEKDDVTALQGNDYGNLWDDIHSVSPQYGKRFHWLDSSTPGITGSYDLAIYRGMNYWENATEFYPNTDNYEVWDENGKLSGSAGSIKGKNVRHHHFPSNRNPHRKSIKGDKLCRTAKSSGSSGGGLIPWKGRFVRMATQSDKCVLGYPTDGTWVTNKFNAGPDGGAGTCAGYGAASGGYGNNYQPQGTYTVQDMMDALWNSGSNRFVADQEMEVRVRWAVVHRQQGSISAGTHIETESRLKTPGGIQTIQADSDGPTVRWDCCGHGGNNCSSSGIWGDNFVGVNSSGGCCGDYSCPTLNNQSCKPCVSWSNWYTLNAGDEIWVKSREDASSGAQICQSGYDYYAQGCIPHWGFSFVEFDIKAAASDVSVDDLHDAKINHNVQRLGFDLEDIKIPQTIADKVQGFRVYYAKRGHADRTVLGQSILIPALYKREILGICEEASVASVDEASQILGALQANPEEFYNMDAWAKGWTNYPEMTFDQEDNSSIVGDPRFASAMDTFSFHDFYLLRSKNSLATATHIDMQYYVKSLVWNGPGLDQDKKMVTLLSPGDDPAADPLKVKEVWNWDAEQNCYPQKMRTAFFAGVTYSNCAKRTQPRLIGQKSKTYLLGDTIFRGSNLGFGGKLFNEFGESCVALKLRDRHAIGAYKVASYPNSNTIGYFADTYGPAPASELEFGHYGRPHGNYSILTNLLDSSGDWQGSGNHAHWRRSQSVMANLKAFKTDVYKSIDSQTLVWTGFEVLGDDLEEYIFDESGVMGGTGNTIDTHPDGIYGGDTFLCRYGISTSLKPSNTGQTSEPEKAVHYHIVESTDNINFRHIEDNDSLYFPGSILKDVLRDAGPTDLMHFDNLRYNKNYSEVNTIRPAFPLPLRDTIQDDFPTRTHRSAKHDTTSIIDNYRVFLANQYRDLPKHRGDLWSLASFGNTLYFHMEESLFAAQGKQTMQMGDGSEAFVGSGDIFQQEPNEIIQTEGGFGGTQSQWATLTTRYGYFFVDKDSRKVFMMKDQLSEISNLGMEEFFRDNLRLTMEDYGLTIECNLDNPIKGFGFTSIYDPKYKRILLTKREYVPTDSFIEKYNQTQTGGGTVPAGCSLPVGTIRYSKDKCLFQEYIQDDCASSVCPCVWSDMEWKGSNFKTAGWTISFYPELGVWGGFHNYVPYLYFNTSLNFYSFTDKYFRPVFISGTTTLASHLGTTFGNAGVWEHNREDYNGILYQEWHPGIPGNITETEWLDEKVNHYPFEFEFIHNEYKGEDTLVSAFNYTLETFNQSGISILEHGFTSYFLYNTFQISGVGQDWQDLEGDPQVDAEGVWLSAASMSTLEYLINIRRIGNNWKVNNFRDMASLATDTSNYYTASGTNIIGGSNTGTITTSSTVNMFEKDGMHKIVNAAYLNLNKNWHLQRKFIDKWVGIRLIYNNVSNNLLNLYSTDVVVRKMYR